MKKGPASIKHSTGIAALENLKNTVLEKISNSILDKRTKEYAAKEALLRFGRKQEKELVTIGKYMDYVQERKKSKIEHILKRFYYNHDYKGFDYIRYFKYNPINSWLIDDYMKTLLKSRDKLENRAKTPEQIDKLEFPKQERKIPITLQLLTTTENTIPEGMKQGFNNKQSGASEIEELTKDLDRSREIEPLDIEVPDNANDYKKLNIMLRHVLKVHNFLVGNKFLHTRKLASGIAIEPVSLLGESPKENIKFNVMRKKVRYLRNVIMSIPPLTKNDSDYLTGLVENPSAFGVQDSFNADMRREYKRFLKRTYTVDENLENFVMNKYAYPQPSEVESKYIDANDNKEYHKEMTDAE